ncbi:MAG: hypothetical protein DRO88_09955 [Promethearchaeia archaeon]|nr:MAG: hypothetical protein DRO88_09955 [Candidatus Lokiarchaeia archaeon]
MKNELLTMRQFLFLRWLANRARLKRNCALDGTDIQCFNCLNKNEKCHTGVIPASYFSKKIKRQYFDCKRVLDSLKNKGLIAELEHSGKSFHVFYRITPEGLAFLEEFEKKMWLN